MTPAGDVGLGSFEVRMGFDPDPPAGVGEMQRLPEPVLGYLRFFQGMSDGPCAPQRDGHPCG